ncbi:hypothetical protein PUN28_011965 [Cardiocondyla obscurior]|uniref:Uncharacterized protein n=1 Tax=Cardiocondyla obscurior TaxID=286306 RepID=A0AAW2FCY1_9HYME
MIRHLIKLRNYCDQSACDIRDKCWNEMYKWEKLWRTILAV